VAARIRGRKSPVDWRVRFNCHLSSKMGRWKSTPIAISQTETVPMTVLEAHSTSKYSNNFLILTKNILSLTKITSCPVAAKANRFHGKRRQQKLWESSKKWSRRFSLRNASLV
jgi:hypothetical protein